MGKAAYSPGQAMVKKTQSASVQAQMDEVIRAEAQRIARATQAPGQSKEESKLIAKGIAKGIAEYKKQEKQKQRERARQQKKQRRVEQHAKKPLAYESSETRVTDSGFSPLPGYASAGVFLLIGLCLLFPLIQGGQIAIGRYLVTPFWSALIALFLLVLAIWNFRSTWSQFRRLQSGDAVGSAGALESDSEVND